MLIVQYMQQFIIYIDNAVFRNAVAMAFGALPVYLLIFYSLLYAYKKQPYNTAIPE